MLFQEQGTPGVVKAKASHISPKLKRRLVGVDKGFVDNNSG